MIKHANNFNTEEVCKVYSERDGVDITYVCTTDLIASDVPVDVFYREEPHPRFGNRYFGLYHDMVRDDVMICNADMVEDFKFSMIQDNDGNYWYSSSHHDCIFIDGSMIDGGRVYTRYSGPITTFKLKDGKFLEIDSWVYQEKKAMYE